MNAKELIGKLTECDMNSDVKFEMAPGVISLRVGSVVVLQDSLVVPNSDDIPKLDVVETNIPINAIVNVSTGDPRAARVGSFSTQGMGNPFAGTSWGN